MSSKLEQVFLACQGRAPSSGKSAKAKKTTKKARQAGGSYASDAVNGSLDVTAFERINFLLSGGSVSALPTIGVPLPSGDAFATTLSSSMVASLAQPLSYVGSMTNLASFPTSFMGNYSPALAN